MISRQAAWETLRDEVMRADKDVLVIKKVREISISAEQDKPSKILFSDGSEDQADLLIGADGLHSIARRSMFEDSKDIEPQTWYQWATRQSPRTKDYVTPQFQGMAGLGGIVPSSLLVEKGLESGTMCLTLGPTGSFGYGYLSTAASSDESSTSPSAQPEPGPIAAWWSSFATPTSTPYSADATGDKALEGVLRRHRSWQDPAIQSILDYVEKHGAWHVYPTYASPELADWQKLGKVVLVGDAAHTLNPSTGQGACQALEDAETLARVLAHYVDRDAAGGQAESVAAALETYVRIRKPRVHVLYEASRKMPKVALPDLGAPLEALIYATLWVMAKFKTWQSYNTFLLGYDLPAEVEKALAGVDRRGL